MKSLPCVDADNYRIDFDESMINVRVADMSRFDEKQLLEAFNSRKLEPVWIDVITPLADAAAPGPDIVAHKLLKPLTGEWRTDESAPQKFWLTIQAGMVRVHATKSKLGFWTSTRTPILSVDKNAITFKEADKTIAMSYKLEGDALTVHIPRPNVFEGTFKLLRKTDEGD